MRSTKRVIVFNSFIYHSFAGVTVVKTHYFHFYVIWCFMLLAVYVHMFSELQSSGIDGLILNVQWPHLSQHSSERVHALEYIVETMSALVLNWTLPSFCLVQDAVASLAYIAYSSATLVSAVVYKNWKKNHVRKTIAHHNNSPTSLHWRTSWHLFDLTQNQEYPHEMLPILSNFFLISLIMEFFL